MKLTILGKQDPRRNDRQISVAMECCIYSSNDACNNDSLTMIRLANITEPPMQGVQAIFFGFGGAPEAENIKVFLNAETSSMPATFLPIMPNKGPCFWSWQGIFRPFWLILLEEQPSISSMSFCVENTKC